MLHAQQPAFLVLFKPFVDKTLIHTLISSYNDTRTQVDTYSYLRSDTG